MADTNTTTLVDKLTNIADGFRTSRSLTETLSLDDMATLAAVPIGGGGENKFAQLVDDTLTEITAEDLEGATKIRDYAFYAARNLEAITIPNTITKIGSRAFGGSSGYPSFSNKITHLVFPNSITTLGNYVCANSQYLQSITLPQNAQFTEIPEAAFNGCTVLDNVVIPENVLQIKGSAFGYCYALSNITLSNSLTYIGHGAFNYCDALTNLTIPASVTEIGASNSLNIGTNTNKATFTFLPTTPPYISTTTFSVIKIDKIIVPAGCGDAYKNATNWANFADFIEEAAV